MRASVCVVRTGVITSLIVGVTETRAVAPCLAAPAFVLAYAQADPEIRPGERRGGTRRGFSIEGMSAAHCRTCLGSTTRWALARGDRQAPSLLTNRGMSQKRRLRAAREFDGRLNDR
jgi:hypothetical protein